MEFQNAERMLKQKMVQYTRSMTQMGNLSNKELEFLQMGVVFRAVKIGYFGMDPEQLTHKALNIIKQKEKAKKTGIFKPTETHVRFPSSDSNSHKSDPDNSKIK